MPPNVSLSSAGCLSTLRADRWNAERFAGLRVGSDVAHGLLRGAADRIQFNAAEVLRLVARRPHHRAVHGAVFRVRSGGSLREESWTSRARGASDIGDFQKRHRGFNRPEYLDSRTREALAAVTRSPHAHDDVRSFGSREVAGCFARPLQRSHGPHDDSSTLI